MTLPDLSRYDRLAWDTETSGLTYEDRPVGLSIASPDGKSSYVRWGHRDGGNNCSVNEARNWMRRELDRPDLTLYAHNAPFELRMAAYEGPGNHKLPGLGFRFKHSRIEDTGFMAAVLNELEPSFALDDLGEAHLGEGKTDEGLYERLAERYGGAAKRKAQMPHLWMAPGDWVDPYARGDAKVTLGLADHFLPQLDRENVRGIYELETSLITFHLDLHLQGVPIDKGRAERLKGVLKGQLKVAQKAWWEACGGRDFNPRAPTDLTILFNEAGLPIKYHETGNPNFAKETIKDLGHPIVDTAIALKALEHYAGTFVDSYLLSNIAADGAIHGEFHPLRNDKYGTVSGRYSSGGSLNLQNIPSRDPVLGPAIRGCFVPARPTMRWAKIDYSQIEFRYFAHYAGGSVLQAYLDDPKTDFHQFCADLAGIDRDPAKNTNFGFLFGMGKAKLGRQLGLSEAEAAEFFEMYHAKIPEMKKIHEKASRLAGTRGYIRTWGGRVRRFRKKSGGGYDKTFVALNALCQGSAADRIKLAMRATAEIVDWDHLIPHLTVHDELDLSVDPGAKGMRLLRDVQDAMENPSEIQDTDPEAPWFQTRVPILAEVELGPDWGHCEKVDLDALMKEMAA